MLHDSKIQTSWSGSKARLTGRSPVKHEAEGRSSFGVELQSKPQDPSTTALPTIFIFGGQTNCFLQTFPDINLLNWMSQLPSEIPSLLLKFPAFLCESNFPDPVNITKANVFQRSTSSTAQGGGESFKNRKPIGEVGCCESGMAERSHWWTERCLRSPLFLSLSLFFSLFLYLSLIIYLPTYWSICLPICLSIYLIYLSVYLSIDLSIYPSIYLSFCLSVCLSIYLSISLSLSLCLAACLPACLPVCLSVCLSVSLSVCLFIYLPVYLQA